MKRNVVVSVDTSFLCSFFCCSTCQVRDLDFSPQASHGESRGDSVGDDDKIVEIHSIIIINVIVCSSA